jgi:hypothetical protein
VHKSLVVARDFCVYLQSELSGHVSRERQLTLHIHTNTNPLSVSFSLCISLLFSNSPPPHPLTSLTQTAIEAKMQAWLKAAAEKKAREGK